MSIKIDLSVGVVNFNKKNKGPNLSQQDIFDRLEASPSRMTQYNWSIGNGLSMLKSLIEFSEFTGVDINDLIKKTRK